MEYSRTSLCGPFVSNVFFTAKGAEVGPEDWNMAHIFLCTKCFCQNRDDFSRYHRIITLNHLFWAVLLFTL